MPVDSSQIHHRSNNRQVSIFINRLTRQIFHPSSPTRDPFLPSPAASHPRLAGSSRSTSPALTEPYPGQGLGGIPDIDDHDDDLGILFADPEYTPAVPNPYAASSSSEEPLDPPISERAKRGWIAHQSVFPPSSSSSATEDSEDLNEPLVQPGVAVPTRLHVYHGRFAHWEREGLRKYKGGSALGES